MDALGIGRAHVAGNSMGGRVAIEVGLRHPDRVGALVLLCPAVAFVKRTYHPLVRVMRPELGLLPHRFARDRVAEHFWSLFADPDSIDPSMADVVVDEFQRIYSSAGGRIAFLASARNLYLDAPFGNNGFYARLSQLEPPALFVWGSHDTVIPPAFGRHVAQWLPSAEQVVLDGCGHVPQVERAAQCIELMERVFARADELQPAAVLRARDAA
jgi:pimeloyl-ACP methyl ester carboxylesterase